MNLIRRLFPRRVRYYAASRQESRKIAEVKRLKTEQLKRELGR